MWRTLKYAHFFVLFLESEAIAQFVLRSREIEYLVEDPDDQQLLYAMIALGVGRWALALFGTNHCTLALDRLIYQHFGYQSPGCGLAINRSKLTTTYGWVSQMFADYIVGRYLAENIFYSPNSPFATASNASTSQQASHTMLVLLLALLYIRYVRKEITFMSFIY